MTHARYAAALLMLFSIANRPARADTAKDTPVSAASQPIYRPGVTIGGVRVGPTSYLTISGVAIDQPVDHVFHLRNARGRFFAVDLGPFSTGWAKVPQDGTLRIYGLWQNGVLTAANLFYDDGLYGSHARHESREIIASKGTLSGTVAADADNYGFDLRDSKGVTHSVLIRRIPAERGAKVLRKGDVVRVSGDVSVVDGVSQMDATNLKIVGRDKPSP